MGDEMMKTWLEMDPGTPPEKNPPEKDQYPEKTRPGKNLALCRFCELDKAPQKKIAWRKLCA